MSSEYYASDTKQRSESTGAPETYVFHEIQRKQREQDDRTIRVILGVIIILILLITLANQYQ